MTAKPKPPRVEVHKWDFKARFRRNAFGWKSQPAVTRVKEAVAEIKAVAKVDPVLAAEVSFSLVDISKRYISALILAATLFMLMKSVGSVRAWVTGKRAGMAGKMAGTAT